MHYFFFIGVMCILLSFGLSYLVYFAHEVSYNPEDKILKPVQFVVPFIIFVFGVAIVTGVW